MWINDKSNIIRRAGYAERCKSGSKRGLSKPTAEMRQGGSLLLYFMTTQRVDGKLILTEAVKYLKMAGTATPAEQANG